MRAAMLGLPSLFDKQVKTQRRNGRELISLLHYHLSVSQTLQVRGFRLLGCEESRNPAKKGRENELLYFRGKPAFAFVLGCEESRNPAKKGRENEFITLVAAD